jgi:hypothetical protein
MSKLLGCHHQNEGNPGVMADDACSGHPNEDQWRHHPDPRDHHGHFSGPDQNGDNPPDHRSGPRSSRRSWPRGNQSCRSWKTENDAPDHDPLVVGPNAEHFGFEEQYEEDR